MSDAWTVSRAQAALGEVAYQLLSVVDALDLVYKGLPPPADLNERQEHRKPFNTPAEVLATIECVLEDHLNPAIRDLQRAAQITDAELVREFLERREKGLS